MNMVASSIKKAVPTSKVSCSHCGLDCTDTAIVQEGKTFCCTGCQTVYNLFHQNGLEQYYKISRTPGYSFLGVEEQQWGYLDDVELQQSLLDFSDGTTARITLHLPNIHCASCIWLLEHLYKLQEGVQQSTVNFIKKEAYILFNIKTLPLSQLVALLHRIGYPPTISLADSNKTAKPVVSKTLLYKLGVTGFIFGNVMFMSFPEYLGLDKSIDAFAYQLFGYLNLLMALPLVLYSGWDYLRSAAIGIWNRNLNIDVPIAIGILSLFGRSSFEILTHSGAGYMDSLAGLLFFLLIGKWFQQRTYHHISFERDYQSYFPLAATQIIDDKEISTALKDLEKGHLIRVRNQELIPADGILKSGTARIDYSFVTGEAIPVTVKAGDLIYAGGRQTATTIELELIKPVEQSYLVQLWNEQIFTHKKKHEQESQTANQIGTYFTYVILLVACSTLFYWWQKDIHTAINAFSAVLIIACPCAVALSIPFTYGNILRLLSRHSMYLKNTGVIERLQHITHIVFDKTGTLTQRNTTLHFNGYLNEREVQQVQSLVQQSNHPISRQISQYLPYTPPMPVVNFKEIIGFGIEAFVHQELVKVQKSEKGTSVIINGVEKGVFTHTPNLRTGVGALLNHLKHTFKIFLLSGDNQQHQRYFKQWFNTPQQIKFNAAPKDKLVFVENLQKQGGIVLMIGDGLNDAGALQQADVGLVISENENNFSPACDGVLSDQVFSYLPRLLQFIQYSRYIIFGAYGFAIVYNLIGLYFAVQGQLSPLIAAILMPLSSITVVLIGTLSSSYLGRKVLQHKDVDKSQSTH